MKIKPEELKDITVVTSKGEKPLFDTIRQQIAVWSLAAEVKKFCDMDTDEYYKLLTPKQGKNLRTACTFMRALLRSLNHEIK